MTGIINKLLAGAMVIVIVIVAITIFSPGGRKAAQRNVQRTTDTETIIATVEQIQEQKKSDSFPEDLTSTLSDLDQQSGTVQMILRKPATDFDCRTTCGVQVIARENCTVDFSTIPREILNKVPLDPSRDPAVGVTGYYINSANGVLTVGACEPEQEPNGRTPEILVTR